MILAVHENLKNPTLLRLKKKNIDHSECKRPASLKFILRFKITENIFEQLPAHMKASCLFSLFQFPFRLEKQICSILWMISEYYHSCHTHTRHNRKPCTYTNYTYHSHKHIHPTLTQTTHTPPSHKHSDTPH